jgi:hypothetical protein
MDSDPPASSNEDRPSPPATRVSQKGPSPAMQSSSTPSAFQQVLASGVVVRVPVPSRRPQDAVEEVIMYPNPNPGNGEANDGGEGPHGEIQVSIRRRTSAVISLQTRRRSSLLAKRKESGKPRRDSTNPPTTTANAVVESSTVRESAQEERVQTTPADDEVAPDPLGGTPSHSLETHQPPSSGTTPIQSPREQGPSIKIGQEEEAATAPPVVAPTASIPRRAHSPPPAESAFDLSEDFAAPRPAEDQSRSRVDDNYPPVPIANSSLPSPRRVGDPPNSARRASAAPLAVNNRREESPRVEEGAFSDTEGSSDGEAGPEGPQPAIAGAQPTALEDPLDLNGVTLEGTLNSLDGEGLRSDDTEEFALFLPLPTRAVPLPTERLDSSSPRGPEDQLSDSGVAPQVPDAGANVQLDPKLAWHPLLRWFRNRNTEDHFLLFTAPNSYLSVTLLGAVVGVAHLVLAVFTSVPAIGGATGGFSAVEYLLLTFSGLSFVLSFISFGFCQVYRKKKIAPLTEPTEDIILGKAADKPLIRKRRQCFRQHVFVARAAEMISALVLFLGLAMAFFEYSMAQKCARKDSRLAGVDRKHFCEQHIFSYSLAAQLLSMVLPCRAALTVPLVILNPIILFALRILSPFDDSSTLFSKIFAHFTLTLCFVSVLIEAELFQRRRFIEWVERRRREITSTIHRRVVDETLGSLLPGDSITRIMNNEPVVDQRRNASVAVAEVHDFFLWSSCLMPQVAVLILDALINSFDKQLSTDPRFNTVEKVKVLGGQYITARGLRRASTLDPKEIDDHSPLILFGLNQLQRAAELSSSFGAGLHIKVGISSGECLGALFGSRKLFYNVYGEAVDDATSLSKHAPPGMLLASQHTVMEAKRAFATETPSNPLLQALSCVWVVQSIHITPRGEGPTPNEGDDEVMEASGGGRESARPPRTAWVEGSERSTQQQAFLDRPQGLFNERTAFLRAHSGLGPQSIGARLRLASIGGASKLIQMGCWALSADQFQSKTLEREYDSFCRGLSRRHQWLCVLSPTVGAFLIGFLIITENAITPQGLSLVVLSLLFSLARGVALLLKPKVLSVRIVLEFIFPFLQCALCISGAAFSDPCTANGQLGYLVSLSALILWMSGTTIQTLFSSVAMFFLSALTVVLFGLTSGWLGAAALTPEVVLILLLFMAGVRQRDRSRRAAFLNLTISSAAREVAREEYVLHRCMLLMTLPRPVLPLVAGKILFQRHCIAQLLADVSVMEIRFDPVFSLESARGPSKAGPRSTTPRTVSFVGLRNPDGRAIAFRNPPGIADDSSDLDPNGTDTGFTPPTAPVPVPPLQLPSRSSAVNARIQSPRDDDTQNPDRQFSRGRARQVDAALRWSTPGQVANTQTVERCSYEEIEERFAYVDAAIAATGIDSISLIHAIGDTLLIGGPLNLPGEVSRSILPPEEKAEPTSVTSDKPIDVPIVVEAGAGDRLSFAPTVEPQSTVMPPTEALNNPMDPEGRSTIEAAVALLDILNAIHSRYFRRISAILTHGTGFASLVGSYQPTFDLLGLVTRHASAVLDAAPLGFLGMTEAYLKLLELYREEGAIAQNGFTPQPSQRWRIRASGLVRVHPLHGMDYERMEVPEERRLSRNTAQGLDLHPAYPTARFLFPAKSIDRDAAAPRRPPGSVHRGPTEF